MIVLLAAISNNNCIGKNGEIPWNIPEDMKRVRELTTGNVVIMGRNTWESIPEKFRPLPNRTNVVITRDANYSVPAGVEICSSISEAIEKHPGEVIVGFGGAKIYEEMMPLADRLEITHVDQTIEDGTAFFPEIDPTVWEEVWREDHDGYTFGRYERKK